MLWYGYRTTLELIYDTAAASRSWDEAAARVTTGGAQRRRYWIPHLRVRLREVLWRYAEHRFC